MATLRIGDFRAGKPVELSLKYTSFRHVAGAFGPQAMLKTSLGTLYLDPEPASNIETQMHDLAIVPGEKIRVTRIKKPQGGYGWDIQRTESTLEEQLVKSLELQERNGHNPVVDESTQPAAASPEADTSRIKPIASNGAVTENGAATEDEAEVIRKEIGPPQHPAPLPATPSIPPGTAKLMACFMQAIDAVAEAQTYCGRRGLGITFTSEDVRATAISYWISCTRDGGGR